MTLNELRYVIAVARERHFGRAAEACFVSQPSLSVAVRKLEEELGISLFERGGGEVKVTLPGERIVAQAQRVLEEADAIKTLARHDRDPLAGLLRLGTVSSIGPYLLPRLIPRLLETAPQLRLSIEEHSLPRLGERLRQGNLDLLLVSLPFEGTGLRSLPIHEESFAVLVSSAHPWAQRQAVECRDLDGEKILLPDSDHCRHDPILRCCPHGVRLGGEQEDLVRVSESHSLEALRCMVAARVGIAVLPWMAAETNGPLAAFVRLRPFLGEAPSRRIGLVWRKSFARTEAIDCLEQALRASPLPGMRPL